MGGIISGILGGGNKSAAQEDQLRAMENSARQLQQYRQEAMQGRMNVLNQAAGAYQGANNALQTMYGGRNAPTADMFGSRSASKLAHPSGWAGPNSAASTSPMANPVAPNPQTSQPRGRGGDPLGNAVSSFLDPLGIFR